MDMIKDRNSNEENHKGQETPVPPAPSTTPVDADESAHELPDREPEVPADPDDLVHTFPPTSEIKKSDDIDDLIHPPAIDGDDPEIS